MFLCIFSRGCCFKISKVYCTVIIRIKFNCMYMNLTCRATWKYSVLGPSFLLRGSRSCASSLQFLKGFLGLHNLTRIVACAVTGCISIWCFAILKGYVYAGNLFTLQELANIKQPYHKSWARPSPIWRIVWRHVWTPVGPFRTAVGTVRRGKCNFVQ